MRRQFNGGQYGRFLQLLRQLGQTIAFGKAVEIRQDVDNPIIFHSQPQARELTKG